MNASKLWFLALAALPIILGMPLSRAVAQSCGECRDQCNRAAKECKKADKGLCKVPGVGGVCKVFKNAHCPASGFICRRTRCGTMPSCNGGGGDGGGQASGEPHFYSLDRMRFDFQAAGEFWVARSKEADIEVQARLVPYAGSKRVSVIAAVAIRTANHTITFLPNEVVFVDAQSIALPREGAYVAEDIAIGRAPMRRFMVATPKANFWVRSSSYLDIYLEPHGSTRGTWEGLFGDFDGNSDNDFRTRDGTVYRADQVDREVLYGKFGDSWRIAQEESLLPYGKGETTETFTNRSFPDKLFQITDLDEKAFASAHDLCFERGVTYGEALRNCIYDIGVTGKEIFAEGYALVQDVQAKSFNSFGNTFGMRVQTETVQGGFVPVFWSGPTGVDGTISIVDEAGKRIASRRTSQGNPALLLTPAKPGNYTVELTQGTDTAKQALRVKEATATITAPDRVVGAEEFELSWTGPLERGDFVALMNEGETNSNRWLGYLWASRHRGTIQAPAVPGNYELWYLIRGAGKPQAIAKRPIAVTAPNVTITPPASVVVGENFEVTWTGPGGRGDYIDLVVKGHDKTTGWLTYGWARDGDDGKQKPAKLRAPAKPGTYTVRYVATPMGGRVVLATADFLVRDTDASLSCPATVVAGSRFEASWSGPNHRGDYVSIAEKSLEPRKYLSYRWARHGKATFEAPAKPGIYQLRYVLVGSDEQRTLASREVVVTGP